MNDRSVDVLARRFGVDGARWQSGPGGLPFLVVDSGSCQARLTLTVRICANGRPRVNRALSSS